MTVKAVELLVPSFLMDKTFMPMWLTFGFISLVAVVLGSLQWIKTRGTKLTNGVRVETGDNLRDYFYAVLEDNDKNQRLVGFTDENLKELYQ